MLANLSLVGCYNRSFMEERQRHLVMLDSAKHNLRHFPFFGLTEYQTEMQYVFEKTFGLKFVNGFTQKNWTLTDDIIISQTVRQKISEMNELDVAFYQYAKDIFLKRYTQLKEKDGGK